MAASLRGSEPGSRGPLARRAVKTVTNTRLSVIMICSVVAMCPVNAIVYSDPVCSYTYHVAIHTFLHIYTVTYTRIHILYILSEYILHSYITNSMELSTTRVATS
jgi:hypothetical protein